MGKPSTDPGLGPSSEARLKVASPEGETHPGAVESTKPKPQKRDTVDLLLEGFEGREERPRILPPQGNELTPTPPPDQVRQTAVRKDLTPTAPGSRQRRQGQMFVGLAIGVVIVLGLAFVAKKLFTGEPPATVVAIPVVTAPVPTAPPLTTTPTVVTVDTPQPTAIATTAPAPTTTTTGAKPKPSTTPAAKPTSRDPHLVIEN
jgi:hypothetical protein